MRLRLYRHRWAPVLFGTAGGAPPFLCFGNVNGDRGDNAGIRQRQKIRPIETLTVEKLNPDL